jgi:NADPH-dependent 2,4-dienoyl-CoA reductase/sulfur reductase-like enzyme/two-component sensor histidine kinase/rhodanese-related sulfurtransferase
MSDKKEERKAEEQVNAILPILSHQLKSPINSIQSLLNTIIEGYGGSLDGKAKFIVSRAAGRAEEAARIIEDILAFQQYSGKQVEKTEEIEVSSLLRRLVNKYSSLASDKNIGMKLQTPAGRLLYLSGDERALEHALVNLLENAVKYTPEGGRIDIELSLPAKEKIRIDIADSGYGIPEDEQEKIFEPFYRSLKHKANIGGTGLGLSIVKNIIGAHEGAIGVDSGKDGTVFSIQLPLLRAETEEEKSGGRKRVLIIGGVTAGPKAAARLRRLDEDCEIILVERGEFLSYSGCCLPDYIRRKDASPRSLMSTADNSVRDVNFFASIKNIISLNNHEALRIDTQKKMAGLKNLASGNEENLHYDTLILATGSRALVPDIPGIDEEAVFTLHDLEGARQIKEYLAGTPALDLCIVGAGLIGISSAEAISGTGSRLTIVEKEAHILSKLIDPDIADRISDELKRNGIKILTRMQIERIDRVDDKLLLHSAGRKPETAAADLIILATGVQPNSELAEKAGIETGEAGGIKVDEYLRTSAPDVYAVGDCAESINLVTGRNEYWPLGSISTKMGRIAADNIYGMETRFEGSIGTAMFKVFGLNVGRTGLTSGTARKHGIEVETAVVSGLDRAHYSGKAGTVILKLIADKKSRRIIGAQGIGRGDIVPRIEILAAAITAGFDLDALFKLDLGYSPVYNSPIDILQTAALLLSNKLDRLLQTVPPGALAEKREAQLIDVSPLSEHSMHSIEGSINIPLENIRREGLPFDRSEELLLYSGTSAGAYEAYRYLVSLGYKRVSILEGGYQFWERL